MSAQLLSPRPRTGTHFSRFYSRRITVFFKKTQAPALLIFLTFFWQKKITKEMWRNVKSGTTKAVPEFTALPSTLKRDPEKFTWRSDNARLRVWFRLYYGLISGISGPDMGDITRWNGAYCRAKKRLSNINIWHSISYKNLSKFAYLRPTESPRANTRLFFGVELKTRTKKSKNLKGL